MSNQTKTQNPLVSGVISGALIGAAMAGFNYLSDMAADVPSPVLAGMAYAYPWRLGRIFYQVAGPEEGTPLVMVHGLHAAASSYEFRYNFDFFVEKGYRVYAPDLLGFGLSDRPAMAYDDEIYIALLGDFLRDVVGEPAIVMATSASTVFAVAAAARHAERVAKLILIAPVGISQRKWQIPMITNGANSLLSSPVLGETLFNLLTTPQGIRYFLAHDGFYNPDLVTDEMVEYHYNVSHMPNAHYAAAAFISGKVNRDIVAEWKSLKQPILLVWGYHGSTTPITKGPEFLKTNPRAVTNGYDAKLLPHYECADGFNPDTLAWLEERRKD